MRTLKRLSFATNSDIIIPISLQPDLIFQTVNFVRSNTVSLNHHRFTKSGCQLIGIRQFEFMEKAHFATLKMAGYSDDQKTLE